MGPNQRSQARVEILRLPEDRHTRRLPTNDATRTGAEGVAVHDLTAANDALALAEQHHQRKAFLTLAWLPYNITLQTHLSRVTFPPFKTGCGAITPGDFYGDTGQAKCDFPLAAIGKGGESSRLAQRGWEDACALVDGLVLKSDEQTDLMVDIVTEQDTWPTITWTKACA
jgi:hypothetical protein